MVQLVNSGNIGIDAIAATSWNLTFHTPATITYSFLTQVPAEASPDDAFGFKPLNSDQRQEVRETLAQWAVVANITFVELNNDPTGDNGQIRIGTNNQKGNSGGYSQLPLWGIFRSHVFSYFDNSDSTNFNFGAGLYSNYTFTHELGHTIGLKHPGNYSGAELPPFLPHDVDNTDYSIMSYNDGASYAINGNFPASPMLYDIEAVQYIYGPNMQYHTRDDTYYFTNSTAPAAIWDAGGVNTFDFSRTTKGATINLHTGAFSSSAPGLHNIAIAYGVTIQNTIGGSGNDIIYCNDANDNINAGAGDDVIYAGKGIDNVDGGTGNNMVIFDGTVGSYSVAHTANGFSIMNLAHSGNVVNVANIQTLTFSDGKISTISLSTNHPPTVNAPLQDTFAGLNMSFALKVPSNTFADPDVGDTLHYGAVQVNGLALPSWLHFDTAKGIFSGIPDGSALGNLYVKVTAVDTAGASASSNFHISTVENFGQAFVSTIANENFTGTNALDVLQINGNRANYSITHTGIDAYTVTKPNGTVDNLVNVDRIKFADATVAIDIEGHGGQVFGLYQAAFNRLPDSGGLGFWINALDGGSTLNAVTNSFISSPEFIATYNNLSNAGFVNQIYLNVLHRQSDPGGAAFWQHGLDSGATDRPTVLLNFTQSAEFQGNLAAQIGNGFSYTPWFG
jgi:hypothetical protein